MPRHNETRRLPYSPEQMFDLVANVGAYSEFLPWVSAIRIRSNSDTEMVADMIVGFKGIRETFTSRVVKQRPTHVRVDYVDGPLKHLHNEWGFRDDGQGGVLVDFEVEFEFKNRIFEMLAGQFFDKALRKMIGAFEERAAVLYGPSGSSSSSAHSAA
ncbi:type II toxin-antitoxin system RatA family toxin [Sphingobium sp. CCH11-B1]|uniref:type II toxin-antitoxin system RatA family toxin n=1 Tax=Sphingobium sp. CCH11-B1 TaxID=1768781 RepID=UPI00082CFB42|nr:type II toxin-antitoxin system RatA family toxin [Sphingobium sp. CCH11-B1]MEA3390407.1 type II toxin-antitoxin system RatA family toxin [Pseudomonadota bacterium]